MTSYAAWAKFDVDAELARVDERLQREEQLRAQQRVEDAASAGAAQDAQVLAAHAAVAALKAKAKARKQQEQANRSSSSSGAREAVADAPEQQKQEAEVSTAQQLQRHAELFRTKHTLMAQIMERRREGERVLRKERDALRALQTLESALESAQELEKIAPELLLAEKQQSLLRDSHEKKTSDGNETFGAGSGAHSHHTHHGHHHSHGHVDREHVCSSDGEAGKCANHRHAPEDPTAAVGKEKPAALPKANDLLAILNMFFKDIYMGIGACHLQNHRLAAASEAFKEVLLRDELHVAAWKERGRVFEQMGAGLLALLHFSRAATLDPQDADAKEALEGVNALLLSDLDDVVGPEAIERRIETLTQSSSSLPRILETIRSLFQEANVLMVEGFFQYAISKYQIVLGCAEFADRQRVSARGEDFDYDLAAAVHDALSQIQTSCCLNIAGGYHEMQKNQARAIEYCEQILAGDPDSKNSNVQLVAHFRIGQLLRSTHNYERAMERLVRAREIAASSTLLSESDEQRLKMRAQIDKELDRCAYERGQHDLAFIRSLAQDAKAAENVSPLTSK